jgi:branched-subunit amino acid ABC-type transport system permease component
MTMLALELTLNGFQLGIMLFVMAAGLSLTLGLMNFLNLAHGAFYMLGAYLAASLTKWSGSFIVGCILGLLITGITGMVLERVAIRRLYARSHLDQVLFCVGFIFVIDEVTRAIWGNAPLSMGVPALLSGTVNLFGLQYPLYRLATIGAGLAVAAGLYWTMARTRVGMLVRAGSTDLVMVSALGANINVIFAIVFAAGAALAALAGMAMGPILSVQLGIGNDVLIIALVVIVIGGSGSIGGALLAALLVGLLDTAGRVLLPAAAAEVTIYLLMAVVLLVRPQGLVRGHA